MILRFLFIILILLVPATSFSGDINDALQGKINEINRQSERLLGISLTALFYLNDANPSDYLLLDYLNRSGKIKDIKELEKKGYVKLEVVEQLPDGQRLGKHLRIIPTAQGQEIQTCIRNMTTASSKASKGGVP